jgi:hypothetical protein
VLAVRSALHRAVLCRTRHSEETPSTTARVLTDGFGLRFAVWLPFDWNGPLHCFFPLEYLANFKRIDGPSSFWLLLQYLANFTATFGYMPLEPLPHNWRESQPPFCAIGWLGCTYLN